MHNITYDYEILQVDTDNRTMMVRYSAEGFEDQLVSMRIPYEFEPLQAVIEACSPVNYWISLTFPISIPEIGTRGTILPPEILPSTSNTSIEASNTSVEISGSEAVSNTSNTNTEQSN